MDVTADYTLLHLLTICRSDHIWSFGQFLDHDLVATVAQTTSKGPVFKVKVEQGTQSATMNLTRLLVRPP